MNITAPVTDYIPASILTTGGDIVRRDGTVPVRLPPPAVWSYLAGVTQDNYPQWRSIVGNLDYYFKAQGAGAWPIFEQLALRDTGIHIGNDTRNAGGAQVITGVGFETSVIIMLAIDTVNTDVDMSWGFDNGTLSQCFALRTDGAGLFRDFINCVHIELDGGNLITGSVTAIGGDGFTITWALTGARGAYFIYLCLP